MDFTVIARTPSRSLRRKRTNDLYAYRKMARVAERIRKVDVLRPKGEG